MTLLLGLMVVAGTVLLGAYWPRSEERSEQLERESILLIGDSFAEPGGLAAPLVRIASASGIAFTHLGKRGTRIDQWASDGDLPVLLKASRPTTVFVSLGTNDEFQLPSVVERQRLALRRLVAQLGPVELLWIAPPSLPRPSNGIRKMLEEELGGRLFHSERLDIERGADGVHPTAAGYRVWADAIWRGEA